MTKATDPAPRAYVRVTGSLSRRLIVIAACWILLLLAGGGFALDRVLTGAITRNFDDQLDYILTSLIVSAEIDNTGEVTFSRQLSDQRFLEPYSGLYWQVSGAGFDPWPSRSLWDRRLPTNLSKTSKDLRVYDAKPFPDQKLRIVERDLTLPGSTTVWRFQVAEARDLLDQQINALRKTLPACTPAMRCRGRWASHACRSTAASRG